MISPSPCARLLHLDISNCVNPSMWLDNVCYSVSTKTIIIQNYTNSKSNDEINMEKDIICIYVINHSAYVRNIDQRIMCLHMNTQLHVLVPYQNSFLRVHKGCRNTSRRLWNDMLIVASCLKYNSYVPVPTHTLYLHLKLTFRQYPAIHTNYMISYCTTLQYDNNISHGS